MPIRNWVAAIRLYVTLAQRRVEPETGDRDLKVTRYDRVDQCCIACTKAGTSSDLEKFAGPVEVDETFIGVNPPSNKHAIKKLRRWSWWRRQRYRTSARRTGRRTESGFRSGHTDAKTLQGYVGKRNAKGATVYIDDHGGYQGRPFEHATRQAQHGRDTSTAWRTPMGSRSFWSLLGGRISTVHMQHLSEEAPQALRWGIRQMPATTAVQKSIHHMQSVVAGMVARRRGCSEFRVTGLV